jgi:Cys-tRNA(Pro)/Cys-tRNA(Cys) deacylase
MSRVGISPLGQRRRHRTFLDKMATLHPRIFVNAGKRGIQVELPERGTPKRTVLATEPGRARFLRISALNRSTWVGLEPGTSTQ